MKRHLKVIVASFGLAATLAVGLAAPLAALAASTAPAPIYTQVIIPGSPVEQTAEGIRGKVTDLAQYIGLIYNFLLGIIGVVAGVSIMWGGFTYLTAGGDKSKVEDGKKRIYNALAGIVLAFTAYLLLNTINPDLVNLKTPQIAAITPEKVPFGGYQPIVWPEHTCTQDSDCTSLGTGYKCFHNRPSGPGKADGQCALEQSNALENATCSTDAQCAKHHCLKLYASSTDGYCSAGSEGSVCNKDGDCAPPRSCVAAGGGYSYCSMGLKGSFCSKDGDCAMSGLPCKTVDHLGRCTPAAGADEGALCAENGDCAGGDVPMNSGTVDNPYVTCLHPPSAANPSCKTGGDYAKNGTTCFCHAAAPNAAKKAGYHCFTDGDCDQSVTPPLTCKSKVGDTGAGVCG